MSDSDIWCKCQTHFILFKEGPLKLKNIRVTCLRFVKGFWDKLYLAGNMVQNLLVRYMLYVCFQDELQNQTQNREQICKAPKTTTSSS